MSRTRIVLRFLRAVYILTPIVVTYIRDRRRFFFFGGPRDLDYEQRRARAERLAQAFEDLGTTYIKLAQFMTTRPDLVPPIYIRAMERLQDEVPPADFRKVKKQLEEDLGDLDEVYDYFNEEAVSGASIAQVHFASVDGEDVAVKVRRPGLEKRVEADLYVLGLFAPLGRKLLVRMGQESHAESAKGIADELNKTIREEMDLSREAGIMTEIRENMEREGLDDRIIIPYVYEEYSTERVLTMSYEEGIAVKHDEQLRREGHDPVEIVDAIAEAYLLMAFKHDVFHADPHQGNLAVAPDGRVIIYDYGIAQRPPQELQNKWRRMFMGVGMHDPEMVVDALQDMGAVDEDVDRETLLEVSKVMIMDISGAGLDDADIERIEAKVDETLYDYPMKFPQEIILGMRATFGVEGLCADMAPDYDFSKKLYDFFIEEMDEKEVPAIAEMGDGIEYRMLDRLDRFLGGLEVSLPLRLPYLDTYVDSPRPVTAFVLRNGDRFGVNLMEQPVEMSNGHTDKENLDVSLSTDDVKEHVGKEMKKSSKRTYLAVLGGTLVLSAAVLHTGGSGLAPYSFGAGMLAFFLAWRSFKDKDKDIMGPKYVATRHRMEQWDEEEDEDEMSNGEAEFDEGFEGFDKETAKEARVSEKGR
jgi:predicted unusual protein kinase regulating ubiquinone biosynthesis (AarF/ABC1/UbiB family)